MRPPQPEDYYEGEQDRHVNIPAIIGLSALVGLFIIPIMVALKY